MSFTIWRYEPNTVVAEYYTTYFGASVRLQLLIDRHVQAYLEIEEGN